MYIIRELNNSHNMKRVMQYCCLNIVLVLTLIGLPGTTSANSFQDVPYSFSASKLATTNSDFEFARSFVGYYYELVQKNLVKMGSLKNTFKSIGACVGDAHLENFGYLISSQQVTTMTMNDIDDFGQCPVLADFLRFLVTTRLYSRKIDPTQLIQSYTAGITSQLAIEPSYLQNLRAESLKKGLTIDPKKIELKKISREVDSGTISDIVDINTLRTLQTYIESVIGSISVLDSMKWSKIAGGSAGLLRYEVLVQKGNDQYLIEFKEQVPSSIGNLQSPPPPSINEKVSNALEFELGKQRHPLYGSVVVNQKTYFVRPRFWGNRPVRLDKIPQLELQGVANFIANRLGQLHVAGLNDAAQYKSTLHSVSPQELLQVTVDLADLIKSRFKKEKSIP